MIKRNIEGSHSKTGVRYSRHEVCDAKDQLIKLELYATKAPNKGDSATST
jgi:hypothetical protein